MSDCDGLRRRKIVVAKQPAAEADNDVITPNDETKASRHDNCLNFVQGAWESLVRKLHHPVDSSSLAVFRTLFGE